MQDAGHGGGGDGIKIKSAGRILDTTAAFGQLRGCRKYAAVKTESINQCVERLYAERVNCGLQYLFFAENEKTANNI